MTGTAGAPPAGGERGARSVLATLAGAPQAFAAGEPICGPGEAMPAGFVMLEGWAGSAVRIDTGRRQLADLILPGDAWLSLGHAVGAEGAGGLIALTPVVAAPITDQALRGAGSAAPLLPWRLADLLAAQNARLVQQVARNGRRTARERVAHLLLELYERLRIKGQARGSAFDLPVGQSVIADTVGLSYVHVSRVLTQLERGGMIERTRTTVFLRDRPALAALSGFDGAYLMPVTRSVGTMSR